MYRPLMLNDSKKISAVCSRFSGGFRGGSVCVVDGIVRDQTARDARKGCGTHQEEVVVLGLCTQVLEDRLLPVSLHVVPVLDLAMADGVVDAVARGLSVGECFIAYEEVEVLDAAFRRKMSGFGWECWACATRLRSRSTSGYRGREYATMGVKTQAVGGSIGALTMTDRNCRRT